MGTAAAAGELAETQLIGNRSGIVPSHDERQATAAHMLRSPPWFFSRSAVVPFNDPDRA
jgi:hypothetical protein